MNRRIGTICHSMDFIASKLLSKRLLYTLGLVPQKKHWEKVDIALKLHKKQGLPDISGLLSDLNEARKAAAYGDTEWPDLDAEDIASDIEEYVDAVTTLLTEGKNE